MVYLWNEDNNYYVLTWLDENLFEVKGMNYVIEPGSQHWIDLSSYDIHGTVAVVQVNNESVLAEIEGGTYLLGSYDSVQVSYLYLINDSQGNSLYFDNN